MIQIIRILSITAPLLVLPLAWSFTYLIPLAAGIEIILLSSRILYIHIFELTGKSITIGFDRYYLPAFLIQLSVCMTLCLFWYFNLHQLAADIIHQSIWVVFFLCINAFVEGRKNIFIITSGYVVHTYKYSSILWNLSDLKKVSVYSGRIEFINGNTKLKAAFADDSNTVKQITVFLQKHIGSRLIIKE